MSKQAVLSPEQKAKEMYRLAFTCSRQSREGKCSAGECAICPFNINQYLDDPQEARIIQASAAIDEANSTDLKRQVAALDNAPDHSVAWSIALFVLCLLLVIVPIGCLCCTAPTQVVNTVTATKDILKDVDAMIVQTLVETRKQIRDMNKDGLINCIDYALLFAWIYPPQSVYCIINQHGNFNHMFNYVYWDGGMVAIEPQAQSVRYTMQEFWGSTYVMKYDRSALEYENKWPRR
jgi:hypothetical protein